MSIFTDMMATVGKTTLAKILFYGFLFLCFMYTANKIGNWVSDRFTKEPTREELVKQSAQQNVVIDAQSSALVKKDETIEIAKDLTTAAIRSMEDHNRGNVKAVSQQAQLGAELDKANTINKAEVITISALEKDESIKKQKLIEADARLMKTQNDQIDAAYQLALQRSYL